MLKVVMTVVVSLCFVFPIICDSIYALAPLIRLNVVLFRIHPSDPYVRMLQHATIYRRNFRDNGSLDVPII